MMWEFNLGELGTRAIPEHRIVDIRPHGEDKIRVYLIDEERPLVALTSFQQLIKRACGLGAVVATSKSPK